MFEKIIQLDKQLLVYLNKLGTPEWDSFWLYITKQFHWAPLFIVVLFFFFKFLGWKKGVFLLFFLAILIAFSDQFVNIIRNIFERLRPNNDPEIQDQLRIFINPQSYSFVSGHATTSTAVAVFAIKTLKTYTRYIYLFLLFPLFFAYSRLYLGVHFPVDILTGICIGIIVGLLAAKLFQYLMNIIFKTKA